MTDADLEPEHQQPSEEEGGHSSSSLVPEPFDTPLTESTVGGLVASLMHVWEGPLPSPDALAAYEEAMPGLAERVVVMGEKEQAFRHQRVNRELGIKERDQETAATLSLRGQRYALAVIVTAAIFGIVLALTGETGPGIAVVLFAIGCVAAVVALGRFDPPWKKPPSQDQ